MARRRVEPDSEVKGRLVEAAARIFADHGYAGARVRDIVEAASVNLAAVNYYFGGKEGLYLATLTELASQRRALWPAAAGPQPAEAMLYEHVLMLVRRVLAVERGSTLGRILAHESLRPTSHFREAVEQVIQPEYERLRGIVARIVATTDEAELTAVALSVMGQCFYYLFARDIIDVLQPGHARPERAEAIARHITDFSLAAMKAAPRAPR